MPSLIWLVSFSVLGCTGGERAGTDPCPADEPCSPAAPLGLHFIGDEISGVFESNIAGPPPTAVGGTQAITLEYDRNHDLGLVALDLPYVADDDGGPGVVVDHAAGPVVTIRGVGDGTNYLSILDSEDHLYDRKELVAVAIQDIALGPIDKSTVPPGGVSLAWAPGEPFAVALTGGTRAERLVDDSMQLQLVGGERIGWDKMYLPTASAGTYPLVVTAGDRPPVPIDVVIVEGADALDAIDPPSTIAADSIATVCFAATAADRFIVGLTWTYQIDAGTPTDSRSNCVEVSSPGNTATMTVHASAGGQSAAIALAVTAQAAGSPPQTRAPTGTTGGERAAN